MSQFLSFWAEGMQVKVSCYISVSHIKSKGNGDEDVSQRWEWTGVSRRLGVDC